MSERFSVTQFFTDGTHETVRKHVELEEAVQAAKHYMRSVAVQMGVVDSVIITDMGDCVVLEWKKDRGIVFPPKES